MSLGHSRSASPSAAGRRSAPLQQFIPSCIYDLDSALEESYSGSGGTWRNITPSPADGSAKSTYDFTVSGNTSCFKGTAGTAEAHWLLDGATSFDLPTNTPFIRDIAKTAMAANAYTFVMAFRFFTTGSTQWLYSMASNNLLPGLTLRTNASGVIYFRQNNNATVAPQVLGPMLLSQKDYLVVVSRSVAGPITRMWINGVLYSSENAEFICADNAQMTPNIGAAGSGSSPCPAGCRIYAASLFNKELGADDVGKIMQAYMARHRRHYS